jgi:putative RNA 2'-phosphotransferase
MNTKKVSTFLSLLLRHKPETVGLTLDEQGWVEVDALLKALSIHGRALSLPELESLVETNDKKRFELSPDRTRIRASQGHSVSVDLKLEPEQPPELLYHGTVKKFLDSILSTGLKPQGRQHVHLSVDQQTARAVGSRRGIPIILQVRAESMFELGFEFYLSANGVWLTDHVPPKYLAVLCSIE